MAKLHFSMSTALRCTATRISQAVATSHSTSILCKHPKTQACTPCSSACNRTILSWSRTWARRTQTTTRILCRSALAMAQFTFILPQQQLYVAAIQYACKSQMHPRQLSQLQLPQVQPLRLPQATSKEDSACVWHLQVLRGI